MRVIRHVEGADPYLEIGGITEVAAARPDCPALLFDAIKGYPRGFRVLTNATNNPRVAAVALGLDPDGRTVFFLSQTGLPSPLPRGVAPPAA